MLRLDRVSKTYFRSGRPIVALDNATLRVEPGEVVAILGRRGSGKTTLLRVAAGLERPDSGMIEVGGQRLDRLSDRERTRLRRCEIGCVWSTGLPVAHATALDVVALPLRLQSGDGRSARAEAERVLESVDAGHCASAQVDELSGGERQLVALAEAIVAKPRLLLLDQISSNLRVADELPLARVLADLATEAKVAIVMTVGSTTEAAAAGRVVSINEGRLLARDTFADDEPGDAAILPFEGRRRGAIEGEHNS